MTIDKISKVINFVNNFCKLAGVENTEMASDIADLIKSISNFEETAMYEEYKNKLSLYNNMVYGIINTIFFMRSGICYINASNSATEIERIVNSIKSDDSSSTINAIETATLIRSILNKPIYKSKRVQQFDRTSKPEIEDLKFSKDFKDNITFTDSDKIKSILYTKSSDIAPVEESEDTVEAIQNDIFGEFESGFQENVDKEEFGQSQFSAGNEQENVDLSIRTIEEMSQTKEDENSGVKTFSAGVYDNGLRRLEVIILNITSAKNNIEDLKNQFQKQLKDLMSSNRGTKDKAILDNFARIQSYIDSHQNLINNYNSWLVEANHEKNIRQKLSSIENEFYSELDSVLSSNTIEKLKNDVSTYNDSRRKMKELSSKKREGKISPEVYKEESKKLNALIELSKQSKNEFIKIKRSRGQYIDVTIAEKEKEIKTNFADDPVKRETYLRGLRESREKLNSRLKEISKLKENVNFYSSKRSNILAKIRISESKLWLEKNTKIQKPDLSNPNISKASCINYLTKIRNECASSSDRVRTLGIVEIVDDFLNKQSDPKTATSSIKEILDFTKKIEIKYLQRTPNQAYNPQPKTDLYESIDGLQQDITSLITNEFAHKVPLADEAFLDFIEDPETQLYELEKKLEAILTERAKNLSDIAVLKGKDSEEYLSELNYLDLFKRSCDSFFQEIERLISSDSKPFTDVSKKLNVANALTQLSKMHKLFAEEKSKITDKLKTISKRNIKMQIMQGEVSNLLNKILNIKAVYDKLLQTIEQSGNQELVQSVKKISEDTKYLDNINYFISKAQGKETSYETSTEFSTSPVRGDVKPIEVFLAKFVGEVRVKILNHIIKYKQSAMLNETTEIYFNLSELNSKIISVKNLVGKLNSLKEAILNAGDLIKDKQFSLLNETISSTRKEIKSVLNEEENYVLVITGAQAIDKVKEICVDILNDNEWQKSMLKIKTTRSETIIKKTITVLNFVLENLESDTSFEEKKSIESIDFDDIDLGDL